MADKDFVVKNGLVVNSTVLVANGTKVGVNTASPDAALTVAGSANLQGNIVFTGNTARIGVSATDSFVNVLANTSFNSNTYFNERIFIGNNQQFVPLTRPVVQAVDNYNGFVQISSQNLANSTSGAENGGTDACADMVIIGDDSDLGYDKFLDIGYNNSNFDGSLQYLEANTNADNLFIGSTVWQSNGVANVAVGILKARTTTNATSRGLVISVANGGSFNVTSGSNGALRDNAGNSATITVLSHRNYPFTIVRNNDGYLYVANGALSIGTSEGGRRANVSDPMYDASGNPLVFHTNGMLAENEVGRFVGNGNFVIGPNTTSRAAKLNVNGTANLAGQTNVGANLNVVGNINATANVNAARGIFTGNVVVGATLINTVAFSVGNSVANATAIVVNGNTIVSTATLRSSNLVIGNVTVTDATGLIRVQNSAVSANMTANGFNAGIVTVGQTTIDVGANASINSTTIEVGNATVNVWMTQNSAAALQVTGNATVSANLTTANLIITNSVLGQANFAGNVAISGNTNVTGNVYASSGVFSGSVNVGIVTLSTTQATVGSNVTLDIAGLKTTGNTLIPSMNVSGGNITVGNTTVANTPTITLANTIANMNVTPGGIRTGNITVNALGEVINVGANVWINATTISIGNATQNVIIRPSDSPDYIMRVTGNASVTGNLLVKGDAIVNGTLTFANTINVKGDFIPSISYSFDLGKADNLWREAYIKIINVPAIGNVSVGNATHNSVMNFDGMLVQNSTSITSLDVNSLELGSNSKLSVADLRIGNSTVNSVVNSTIIVTGTGAVNSVVNASHMVTTNVLSSFVNSTTSNTTTANATTVNATTVNASAGRFVSVNSSTANIATVNSSTITAANITANVFAITINSTSINSTSINSTSINATSVNATTVNATTLQVGSAFRANSSQVTTANLTVIGNMQVTGTTTFVNTAVMDVTDSNITLAKGAANPAAADGGGITLEGANAEIVYVNGSNAWMSNVNFIVGNSTSNVTVGATAFTGNTVGVHSGNVIGTTVTATANVAVGSNYINTTALVGNLVATNINVATVNASTIVRVGANAYLINDSLNIVNSTANIIVAASFISMGNSSITSTPYIRVQNASGTSIINSNFISTNNISGNLAGNVAATVITASANITVGSVYTNTTAFVGNTVGVHTGNVSGTTVAASSNVAVGSVYVNTTALVGNVVATNINVATVNATSIVRVGANVSMDIDTFNIANSVATTAMAAGQLALGNSTITSPPVILVQNSSGFTYVYANGVISPKFTGNVVSTSISTATLTASSNITLGATTVANSTGVWATHLGDFPAASYPRYSDSGKLSMAEGGTNTAITPAFGGVAYSNSTGLAITAAGTAGFILMANGSGNPPVWRNSESFLVSYDSDRLGGTLASSYQLNSALAANVQTMRANDANNLGGYLASQYYRISGPSDVALADGGTNSSIAAAVPGGIVYSNATGMAVSTNSTSGYLLQSGGGGAPTWIAPASLTVNNSNLLDGNNLSTSITALTVVGRDSAADVAARLFKSNYADNTTGMSGAMAYRISAADGFIRFTTNTASIKTWLGFTISPNGPSAGEAGDVWFQYTP